MKAKLLLAGALLLGLSCPLASTQPRAANRQACMTPIEYRIGRLDARFGITLGEFQRAVEEAASAWEGAAGRKLFRHVGKGPLEINLVYDSRQETTQRLIAVRTAVSDKLQEVSAMKRQLRPLQDRIGALDAAYSAQLSSYKRLQDEYNRTVVQWNGRGGAPEAEYQRLDSQRLALKKEAAALEEKRQELNRLADAINELADKHNKLLHRANDEADAFNRSAPSTLQFEEGRYIRQGGEERIDIFQYDGETALRIILSHELGHALRIRHNGNPSSIMSPLIHAKSLALTPEDVEGLKATCS